MKVGIIGSGGREHAICQSLRNSNKIDGIYCFPGNAGTADIAENVILDLENFENIKNFILNKKIDLVVIGPEKPLTEGLVDYLKKFKIKVFGPNKIASQLEGSKIFTKKLCEKFNIPTAKFGIFQNKNDAKLFCKKSKYPTVIKADNLASGKGVYICHNEAESNIAIDEIFNGKFGKAKNLLIEEFLQGEEMSFFTIHDGNIFKNFGTAQDHKRVSEGDKGKNTGGMGAYSPSRLNSKILEKKIINKIIVPTLDFLKKENGVYVGFLYAGLIVKDNEPYLIEYNVRMGDPECQTILPLLENDFVEVIKRCVNGKLNNIELKWKNKKSICVVLTSQGYPDNYKKDILIENLEKLRLSKYQYVFHAGTKIVDDKFFSCGGRVLNFVSLNEDFKSARERTIDLIKTLNWKNGFYRRDIGFKVID